MDPIRARDGKTIFLWRPFSFVTCPSIELPITNTAPCFHLSNRDYSIRCRIVCGLESFNPDADTVCCQSNATIGIYTYSSFGWPDSGMRYFCTDQPDGTDCGVTDAVCASGSCVRGKCSSSASVVESTCSSSADCAGSSCGYDWFSPNAPSVCCPPGATTTVYTSSDWLLPGSSNDDMYDDVFDYYGSSRTHGGYYSTYSSSYQTFCSNQRDGTACGETDDICASGACVGGVCTSYKLPAGSGCGTNNDCSDGICGYQEFSLDAPTVCCPPGGSVSVYTGSYEGWPSGYQHFCSGKPIGSACGETDSICASNMCVAGQCASQKLVGNSTCMTNNDCLDGACGYQDYSTNAVAVCCLSGATLNVYSGGADGWPSSALSYDADFCTEQPQGAACGRTDGICESNACVAGTCQAAKLVANSPCTIKNDCERDACGYESFSPNALTVCCASGATVRLSTISNDDWDWMDDDDFSALPTTRNLNHYYGGGGGGYYSGYYSSSSTALNFCTGQPNGADCGVSDDICDSNACVLRKCASAKLAANSPCSVDNDCAGGSCGFETFSISSSTVCCPSGATTSIYTSSVDGWASSQYRAFCTSQPIGTACGTTDGLCVSSSCVGGVCANTKLGANSECSANSDCVEGACGLEQFDSSASSVCCSSGSTTSIYTGWPSSSRRSFCLDQPDGTACGTSDEICASNACIAGICSSAKLAASQPCSADSECSGGSCGLQSFDSSASTVCCSSGATVSVFSLGLTRYYCSHQPGGTSCGTTNAICASNSCLGGVCASSAVVVPSTCTASSGCPGGSCGLQEFSPNALSVCCPSGATTSVYTSSSDGWTPSMTRFFCTNQPDGTACGTTDSICASNACVAGVCESTKLVANSSCATNNDCSGGSCGLNTYDPSASTVCCSSGRTVSIFTSDGWPSSKTRAFCTEQPDGEACGTTDGICASNACLGGVCVSKKLAANANCTANNECAWGSCAHEWFDSSASTVCCSSGATTSIFTHSSDGWATSAARDFCTNQPEGKPCGTEDVICASKACVLGSCAETKLAGNSACITNNDCAGGSCGLESFDRDALTVCCNSGATTSIYTTSADGWPSSMTRAFCTDQPDGTNCGDADDICASGACIGGTCSSEKLPSNSVCSSSNHCANGSCGLSSFHRDASSVCCSSGATTSVSTYSADGWPSSMVRDFCTNQPDGTDCGEADEICATKACVAGVCSASKLAADSACSSNDDCTDGACGYQSYSTTADTVCCLSGSTTSVNTYRLDGWPSSMLRDFCTDQPGGTACGVTNSICASNSCVGGVCTGDELIR